MKGTEWDEYIGGGEMEYYHGKSDLDHKSMHETKIWREGGKSKKANGLFRQVRNTTKCIVPVRRLETL